MYRVCFCVGNVSGWAEKWMSVSPLHLASGEAGAVDVIRVLELSSVLEHVAAALTDTDTCHRDDPSSSGGFAMPPAAPARFAELAGMGAGAGAGAGEQPLLLRLAYGRNIFAGLAPGLRAEETHGNEVQTRTAVDAAAAAAAATATDLEAGSVGGGGGWGVGVEALRAIKRAQVQARALARCVMAPPAGAYTRPLSSST
jgi:hypothetical protein